MKHKRLHKLADLFTDQEIDIFIYRARLRTGNIEGSGILAAVSIWFLRANIQIATLIKQFRTWPYEGKMGALFSLTFFGSLPFAPLPPHPDYILTLLFLGELGLVIILTRRFKRWVDRGFPLRRKPTPNA